MLSVDDTFELNLVKATPFFSQLLVDSSTVRDYLSVMVSSVLSERAFLLVGITITKHRN